MTRRARILAVDDENDILLIVRTSLKDEYDVETASSGVEALQKIEENPPDLVILDMMMPEMDGIEVLEEIRRMTLTATTPVIFLTGVSDKAKIREALDKGTQYYITKPFNYNELLSKVAIALNGT
ncbi:response regulator [Candidatus Sumerlaeota bacterium]|nr:response regulator [Candidatus Sumerlaeota bacterium]